MLRRDPRPDLSRPLRAKGNLSFLSHLSDIRHIATIRFPLKGDRLLEMLAALANPCRLRIAAVLATGVRDYVGKPAGTWHQRPLLRLHHRAQYKRFVQYLLPPRSRRDAVLVRCASEMTRDWHSNLGN